MSTTFDHLAVFVPASGTQLLIVIRGSAIVGLAGSDDTEQVTVYFEGNLYRSSNIRTYADRARIAAGRLIAHYPTVARATIPYIDLRQVGWFAEDTGITLLDGEEETVASWLGVETLDPNELHFSGL